jgi:hypothetical protein
MGLIQRFFRPKPDHEAWLTNHPGKDSKASPPPELDPAQEAHTREQMESELARQRAQRESQ